MKLKIAKRTVVAKQSKHLVKQWILPGVVYGRHLSSNLVIEFDKQEFLKLYKKAWETTPINLEGDGVKELVLIHDIQVHPVSNFLLHVDFLAVKADEKVRAEVPVILVWESILEKNKEAQIELVKDHVLVEAFPLDLPHNIEIDKAQFTSIHGGLFVKDLNLWKKVVIKDDEELSLVSVVALTDEVEEETTTDAGTEGSTEAKTE